MLLEEYSVSRVNSLTLLGSPPTLHTLVCGDPSFPVWIGLVESHWWLQPFGAFELLKVTLKLSLWVFHSSAVISCCRSPPTSPLHLLFSRCVMCPALWTCCCFCWGHSAHVLYPTLLTLQLFAKSLPNLASPSSTMLNF